MTASRRTVGLGIGAVVVAVIAVVAQLSAPSGAVPVAVTVPVVSTELVCPDARTTATPKVDTQVSAVTPSNLAVGTAGRADIGTLTNPVGIATIKGRSHSASANVGSKITAVTGTAIDGRAPGFAMDQLTVSAGRSTHGLSGVTCTEPDNDAWFVGTGSAVGHTSTLFLTDAEATPATVDVAIYGKDGRIDAPGGLGLQVAPKTRRVVHLDLLAPGAGTLAVHVTASAGRVGASVFDSQVHGLEPRGSDWLPVSQPPARSVIVPGLGIGDGSRMLSVYAPGEGTATVNVRLIGQQGSFAPAGAASLEIDRGKVATVDLGAAIGKDNVAVGLDSDVPLVAGVQWTVTSGSVDDLAFSAGTEALTAPAVVTGLHNAGAFYTNLLLTAPGKATSVSIATLRGGVPVGRARVLPIGADRTVRVALPSVSKGAFSVVLTPGTGGPLYVAVLRLRSVDGANGTTVSVVRNARITVGVPQAAPNLDVGLGR